MSNIIGVRNNNTIIPYVSAQKRTKEVNLTVTGTNWTTSSAIARAYADSTGIWRLVFNIVGTLSSGTTLVALTVSGVTFNSVIQAITAYDNSVGDRNTTYARTNASASTLQAQFSGTSTQAFFSGDVALSSEPTWAAANMEGVVAADVYIAPASATVDGIVNRSAQTIAGVKTFNDGIKLDDAAGQTTLNYYKEYAEADLDTITITGGTWSTIDSAKYKAVRIGNKVTIWFRIESTTAASALTSFEVRLPGTLDIPADFSTTANGEIGFYGFGHAAESANGAARVPVAIGIEKAVSIQIITVYTSAAISAKLVVGCIEYTV